MGKKLIHKTEVSDTRRDSSSSDRRMPIGRNHDKVNETLVYESDMNDNLSPDPRHMAITDGINGSGGPSTAYRKHIEPVG